MPTVCILLPALNEEETIGKVIDNIPFQQIQHDGYNVEVLVVNNNSIDHTAQVAKAKGARVITELSPGKGRAVRTGLASTSADFIIMFDADNTYSPVYIPEMLELLDKGYPVVIGSRLRGGWEKGAIKPLNVIGNLCLTFLADILYRSTISDVCTGCWGIRHEVVSKLNLSVNGFQFEAELFSKLAKGKYKIAEIPIYYKRRPNHPKLASIRDGLKIGWTLISRRFRKSV
jgi:dolichol-phosphate hexosyltransferase